MFFNYFNWYNMWDEKIIGSEINIGWNSESRIGDYESC